MDDRERALAALAALPPGWELRLASYAAYLVRTHAWRRGGGGKETLLAEGNQIIDIVQEAVAKVLAREHRWNPTRQPDVFAFLRDVVRRLVSNLSKGKDNQTAALDEARAERTEESRDDLSLEQERAMEEIMAAAKERTDIGQVVDAMMDGHLRPEDVAEVTGLAVKDIYNILKVLRRRVRHATGDGALRGKE